ncbi:hypothetical protein FSP39_016815 [Pinctada imbricata]|uniref:TNFR-Cys domain-containing protein n=1 Tax=Pinctada imbricata TaxID=66713 RepID=A0AA88Y853_PINIB|nr:hypothetical protein FSP39_016815 [Pinctada imbricata]
MMMLVTIHAVLTMEAAASSLMCRAEDHVYYHEQLGGCLNCEPCNPGEEQMDIQKWAASIPSGIFTIYGPTQCPTCITCREGYFNSERAFQCTRCKNCTLHNKHEVEQCSSISDAECDGVLIDKR